MTAFIAPSAGAGVVEVSGPDARSFLQSLVSQDVDPLRAGDGARSLLLQPQGKLTAQFRLLCIDDERFLLDTDPAFGPVLADGLNRFRIRVKAEVADRSDSWAVLCTRGEGALAGAQSALGVSVPASQDAHVALDDARVVRSDWPGVEGVDLVGPRDTLERARVALEAAGFLPVDADVLERARIEAGVARQGVDIDEATIPQEAFLERDAVSFTKGCFLGQELVCRIDTRGHVNRHLRRLDITGGVPERGAEVVVDDRVVGTVTSVAPTDTGAVALAMVRREVEPPATVQLRWPHTTTTATVKAL